MAEPEPGKRGTAGEIQTLLHALAKLLHQAHHLGEEAREELADLVAELGDALQAEALTPEQLAHLADSTNHLMEAVQQESAPHGVLAAARQRLEKAVVSVEGDAPVAAGIVRRLLDALANLGI